MPASNRIAIVTCAQLPEPDPDEAPLLEGLRAAGMDAHMLAWDATPGPPGHASPAGADFDCCVIRSTWNYYHDPDAFLAWIDACAARSTLLNPAPAVRWNIHKHYLRDLDRAGLPIVPTEFVDRGEKGGRASFADILRARDWTDAVIKPCVSAASFNTRRFSIDEHEAAQQFLDELASTRDAMLQPYMRSVDTSGERSIIWIANRGGTHAIRKNPRFAGQDESVSGSLPVTDSERDLFDRTLAALPFDSSDLLYARLDLMPDDTGRACISELELIEPSLFLLQEPRALRALVDAIAARA